MKLLLDTHCWLWWLVEPEKLSETTTQAIMNSENELWLSVASIWKRIRRKPPSTTNKKWKEAKKIDLEILIKWAESVNYHINVFR